MVIRYGYGWYSIFLYWCAKYVFLEYNTKFQRKQCWEYGIIHKYASFTIKDNTPSSKSTKLGSWNRWIIRMVAIPLDKINYNKVSKCANVLIFKEFYPKTKNVSYYLKSVIIKVLRPSDPHNWKNVEWKPHVFSKEYCSECQTNRVMGQQFGTITFCHL